MIYITGDTIVIGGAYSVDKYIPVEAFIVGLSQDEVDRSTEDWLDCIEDKLSYKTWYCGHWHINKRIDKIQFCALLRC